MKRLTIDRIIVCSKVRRWISPKKGHEKPVPSATDQRGSTEISRWDILGDDGPSISGRGSLIRRRNDVHCEVGLEERGRESRTMRQGHKSHRRQKIEVVIFHHKLCDVACRGLIVVITR